MGVHTRSLFPETVSYGTRSAPRHAVAYSEGDSGHGSINVRWPAGRTRSELRLIMDRVPDDIAAQALSFYRCQRGAAFGWRARDWADWSTHPNNNETPNGALTTHRSPIGAGDGVTSTFGLVKYYYDKLIYPRGRRIWKPIPPGYDDHYMKVYLNGAEVTEGSIYTVDYDQGVVRFIVPVPSGVIVEAAFTYHNVVRFGPQTDAQMQFAITGPGDLTGRDLVAHECSLNNQSEHHDEWPHSENVALTISTSPYQLALTDAFLLELNGHATNTIVKLPSAAGLDEGGPYFLIVNKGNTVLVKDSANGTTFATLTPNQTAECWVYTNTAGVGWEVR